DSTVKTAFFHARPAGVLGASASEHETTRTGGGGIEFFREGGEHMTPLKVGDAAPDFDVSALIGGNKKKFRLSQCKGKKHVVLAFHPVNWTPVCARQMAEYNAALAKFVDYDAQAEGISVVSI